MDLDTLWTVADRARAGGRMLPDEIKFGRAVVPKQL